ncbi:hypothetical protein [Adonisia turfae]|uniref:hypothetical protein n=1 Tax=Adonisia turfae TaxID=2950184 RepID=UPI0013D4053C|nr:hypothetical protein [Adonisia turfae]
MDDKAKCYASTNALCSHSAGTDIETIIKAIDGALNAQAHNIAKALEQPQGVSYQEYLEIYQEPDVMERATTEERVDIYDALIARVEILDGDVAKVLTRWDTE